MAPGELISILGQQLSGGELPAGVGTLPTVLAGTQVLIGSQAGGGEGQFVSVPLLFASGSQVNAAVPFGTTFNVRQAVLLQWR